VEGLAFIIECARSRFDLRWMGITTAWKHVQFHGDHDGYVLRGNRDQESSERIASSRHVEGGRRRRFLRRCKRRHHTVGRRLEVWCTTRAHRDSTRGPMGWSVRVLIGALNFGNQGRPPRSGVVFVDFCLLKSNRCIKNKTVHAL